MKMWKLASGICLSLALILPLCAYGISIGNIQSDVVIARAYGGHTYAALTDAVARIGTLEKTLVLDGGTWPVSANLTLPTNITLLVARDSSVEPATDVVLTVFSYIASGDYKIFGGLGTVTGRCANLFVHDNWYTQNVNYLGPSHVAWATNMAKTQDIAILVSATSAARTTAIELDNILSNSLITAMYTADTNVSNGVIIHADASYLSKTATVEMTVGTTLIVDRISYSNMPLFGATIVNSSTVPQFISGPATSNQWTRALNYTENNQNNYSNSNGSVWMGGTNDWLFPNKIGQWSISGNAGFTYTGNAIYVECIAFKNVRTNNPVGNEDDATYLGMFNVNQSLERAVLPLYGSVYQDSTMTNIWSIYYRARPAGGEAFFLSFSTLEIQYLGDPALAR